MVWNWAISFLFLPESTTKMPTTPVTSMPPSTGLKFRWKVDKAEIYKHYKHSFFFWLWFFFLRQESLHNFLQAFQDCLEICFNLMFKSLNLFLHRPNNLLRGYGRCSGASHQGFDPKKHHRYLRGISRQRDYCWNHSHKHWRDTEAIYPDTIHRGAYCKYAFYHLRNSRSKTK